MTGLAGTGTLVRLALRRDRIVLPVWIVLLSVLPASTVSAYEQLYPTAAERTSLQLGAARNPSLNVLYGPPFDVSTAGGFTAYRYVGVLAILVGLLCVFTVTRHTRAEEETGRLELLGAGVLGRYAALTAAVLVAGATAVASGLLETLGLLGAGRDASGAFAFGLAIAAVGLVFTGIAALTAQLTEYSRSSNGIACAVLGIAFVLRAAGDAATNARWLSWLSPIGWAQQVRAFAGERWWILALPFALAVLATAAGYLLAPRRDLDAGILPSRPGPSVASAGLRSPLALAWRMHRGALLGWMVGFAVIGAMLGSIASGIGDLVGSSEQTRQLLERMGGTDRLVDTFLAVVANMYGLIAVVYAAMATLRMRSEETAFRAEPVLATTVRRWRWAGSHLVFSVLGTGLVLAAAGTGTGLAHGLRVGDVAGTLPEILGGTLAALPAIWVVVGIATVLYGFFPRYMSLVWGFVAVILGIGLFGPALGLDQAVLDISPFAHIPKLPGTEFTMTPLLWLTGVATVAVIAGYAAFRRRDIG